MAYRLCDRLAIPEKTISCLAIDGEGRLMAGGCFQRICLWSLEEKTSLQEISEPGWGRIICLQWLWVGSAGEKTLASGCANGIVNIYRQATPGVRKFSVPLIPLTGLLMLVQGVFVTLSTFKTNTSIEAMAFDSWGRLAVGESSGSVTVYQFLEREGAVERSWSTAINPHSDVSICAVQFCEEGFSVEVFCSRFGTIYSLDADSGLIMSEKSSATPIASVVFASDKRHALISDGGSRYDLYRFPHMTLVRSFVLDRASGERLFIPSATFAENDTLAILGRSDGKAVQVCDLGVGGRSRILEHGTDCVRTMTTFSYLDRHIIIAVGQVISIYERPATPLSYADRSVRRVGKIVRFVTLLVGYMVLMRVLLTRTMEPSRRCLRISKPEELVVHFLALRTPEELSSLCWQAKQSPATSYAGWL
ncbi:hypothetical protein SISNIDRAFT_489236 [Sistotremastrum niveocremeum HHB9708]|uniref:WD40 repeat-like protein n=1 Tax=Sistotremastrum niveocremeum HHB9708 TaxID=1314777 RepID=A0A164QD78_9AGAM|nr:hypothetical protein SISNIDRAFT_489236 [Sistotremastrum niveocremeum HHB9708]